MPLLQKMATTSASATNRWVFLRLHNIPQVAKSIGIARMGRLAATAPVNKLVSLTWLLWALRSFRSFTLHYIYNCGAAVGSGQTLGCPNKTFFKSSQVSPYGKFPYDQNIPHKKFQII